MLRVELANACPAVQRTPHRHLMLVFRRYCCSKVLKVCWISRHFESLNQAPPTVISVKERVNCLSFPAKDAELFSYL